jgi:trypsin
MAKLLFSIVLVALVASTSALPRRLKLWPTRIVGGQEVDVGSVPYQISLQYYDSHICGGSILNENYIVTAAHCAAVGSASSFKVAAGIHSIRAGANEPNKQVIQVSAVVSHEDYNDFDISNDIALMKLSTPLKLGGVVQAIQLQTESVAAGVDAYVTGWGTTTSGGSLPAGLRGVTVPIVSDADCREAYGQSDIFDSMICAGLEQGGKDSCQGDSGGPLATGSDATLRLTGIVSWGYGCAVAGYPGVYTEVSHFTKWVADNAK